MQNLFRFLFPSNLLLLVYIIISLAALLIASSSAWINQYVDQNVYAGFMSILNDQWQNLFQYLRELEGVGGFRTLVTFLFWLVAGSLIYMLIWLIFTIIHAIYYEVKVSLVFVHPKSFKESGHWLAVISRWILRIASVLVLVGFAVLFVEVLWPAIATSFTYGLLTLTLKNLLLYSTGSLLLFVANLHIFYLLINLAIWRKP